MRRRRPGLKACKLPRALRALANEAGGHPRRASPSGRAGAVTASASMVVGASRATRVPEAAVTSGMQRSVTVTRRRRLGRAHAADLGRGRRPKLHGMQGVNWMSSDHGRHAGSALLASPFAAAGTWAAAANAGSLDAL